MTANDGTSALALPKPRDMAELAITVRQALMEMRVNLLKPGVDYGKIPGTSKDVLLKPGAEKLSSGFKLYPVPKLLTSVEDWNAGFFYYRYQIDLMHRETGEIWGTGIGSCNSREKKYAYRWVTETELPAGIDKETLFKEDGVKTLSEFTFAVEQAKTSGDYAKSAEYWQMFKDAIVAGTAKKTKKKTKAGAEMDAWEITAGIVKYRVPNSEIYEQVNTIDKMAFKRSYVAAVLIATGASEFFTQDMEDFANIALPDEDNVIEGQVVDVTPPPATVAEEPQKAPPQLVTNPGQHWSKDPVKMAKVIAGNIEKGYLPAGGTERDLLDLVNQPDWLSYETYQNHAAPAIQAAFEAKAALKAKLDAIAADVPSADEIKDTISHKPGRIDTKATLGIGDARRVPTDEEIDGVFDRAQPQ